MNIFENIIKNQNSVLELISKSIASKDNCLITYINQHCFNIYNLDKNYKDLIENNFTVFLDGFGVYAALKFLGYKDAQKFNATDLYRKIFQQFSLNKTKLFLIGGNFTNEFISEKTKEKKLNICGYQNGYFKNGEFHIIIETIDISSPEVIVIGMGVPKQEMLAAIISESIQNQVILCVGGFLEFYFDTKKRAPDVMINFGFEWLHRLIKEPGRLWKRYFIGIPIFILRILRVKFLSKH